LARRLQELTADGGEAKGREDFFSAFFVAALVLDFPGGRDSFILAPPG
jgi:hypothetical protein